MLPVDTDRSCLLQALLAATEILPMPRALLPACLARTPGHLSWGSGLEARPVVWRGTRASSSISELTVVLLKQRIDTKVLTPTPSFYMSLMNARGKVEP